MTDNKHAWSDELFETDESAILEGGLISYSHIAKSTDA